MALKHLLYYWINVYEVTRCYGGPEGGGWWYDRMECVESVRSHRSKVDTAREAYQWAHEVDPNNKGKKFIALVEDHRAQSQTTEAPEYG